MACYAGARWLVVLCVSFCCGFLVAVLKSDIQVIWSGGRAVYYSFSGFFVGEEGLRELHSDSPALAVDGNGGSFGSHFTVERPVISAWASGNNQQLGCTVRE